MQTLPQKTSNGGLAGGKETSAELKSGFALRIGWLE